MRIALDWAQSSNIKIVIVPLSLPGARWKQNNQNKDDNRLWRDENYQKQAILFWKNLAFLLKDHPTIFGYSILNEPHPEFISGIRDFRDIDFQRWYQSIEGTNADLNFFYKNIVAAIREVDVTTPIILDTAPYATSWAIKYLQPIKDDRIVCSFHIYEPYNYTTRTINKGKIEYPGDIPLSLDFQSASDLVVSNWDFHTLEEFLNPVVQWQKDHQILSSQILVGEFGCNRTSRGAGRYLSDLLKIFDNNHWHWAFYAFREGAWDSMDYELGEKDIGQEYWDLSEQGGNLDKFRTDNLLFDVIKNALLKDLRESKNHTSSSETNFVLSNLASESERRTRVLE